MKIEVIGGRVIFSGVELKDADLDTQLKSNDLLQKVDNDYTFGELAEMLKVKGLSMGVKTTIVTENI